MPQRQQTKPKAGGDDDWATVGKVRGGGLGPKPGMSSSARPQPTATKANSFASLERSEKKPREEDRKREDRKEKRKEDKPDEKRSSKKLDFEDVKRELATILAELSGSQDVEDACMCFNELAIADGDVPPTICELLVRGAGAKASDRGAILNVVALLADRSYFGVQPVLNGLGLFFDEEDGYSRYEDCKEDAPILPTVLRDELFPKLGKLSEEFEQFRERL